MVPNLCVLAKKNFYCDVIDRVTPWKLKKGDNVI